MAGLVYVPVVDLVRVLSLPTALKLSERFGGRRIYVKKPGNIGPEDAIARAIGVEAAKQLAEEWPGFELMLPLCAEQLRRERNRLLRADRDTLSGKEAALKWETTERNVFRIWASEPDDELDGAPPAAQRQLF